MVVESVEELNIAFLRGLDDTVVLRMWTLIVDKYKRFEKTYNQSDRGC